MKVRRPWSALLVLSFVLLAGPWLRAEGPAVAAPESAGLSSERLQRLRAVMQRYVGEGKVAGVVTYLARGGRIAHHDANRDEPVSAVVERLAGLPMDAQPGEKFVYGYNTDIVGVVVEKVSGQSLDQFFQKRILGPLGMTDTSFYLPPEKKARLAAVYSAKEDGRLERAPEPGMGQGRYVEGPRVAFSSGAGLLSTARDYGRFLQMLLNGGELDGVRLLSPKTVELMTVNHVGSLYNEGNTGFGLGFEVVENLGRAGRYGSVSAYGWGGAYFTTFWVDPQDKLVAVFLAQLLPSGGLDLQQKFRTLVYQTIIGPASGAAPRRAQ